MVVSNVTATKIVARKIVTCKIENIRIAIRIFISTTLAVVSVSKKNKNTVLGESLPEVVGATSTN
jgi:hypothetical protein